MVDRISVFKNQPYSMDQILSQDGASNLEATF